MTTCKKVSFDKFSQEYYSKEYFSYDNPILIETKTKDGPNLYTSFFEQFILSYLLQRESLSLLLSKYYLIIQASRPLILINIQNILYHLRINNKYNFYLVDFCLRTNPQTIYTLQDLYHIIS